METPSGNDATEVIYYYAMNSKYPFVLTNLSTNGKTKTPILPVDTMDLREARFNRLWKRLQDLGWMQHLQVIFNREEDDIYFDFCIKNEYGRNTFLEDMPLPMFRYSLITNRIKLLNIRNELMTVFFMERYDNDHIKSDFNIEFTKRNGWRVKAFCDYLEKTYKHTADKAKTKGITLSRLGFLKLTMLYRLGQGETNSKTMCTTFLVGTESFWIPYITDEALMANLVHILSHKVNFGKYLRGSQHISNYKMVWKGDYQYTPEQVKEALSLPHDWFKELYPINILDWESI